MKLKVDGVEYDLVESMQGASLLDIMKLKVKTKGDTFLGDPEFKGITLPGIQKYLGSVNDRTVAAEAEAARREREGLEPDPEAFTAADLLGDIEFLLNVGSLVWLSRRKVGDKLEVEEALAVSFRDIEFVDDDEDDEADADPKASGSDPDAAPAAQ